jgi:hypothetical protein
MARRISSTSLLGAPIFATTCRSSILDISSVEQSNVAIVSLRLTVAVAAKSYDAVDRVVFRKLAPVCDPFSFGDSTYSGFSLFSSTKQLNSIEYKVSVCVLQEPVNNAAHM